MIEGISRERSKVVPQDYNILCFERVYNFVGGSLAFANIIWMENRLNITFGDRPQSYLDSNKISEQLRFMHDFTEPCYSRSGKTL